MPLCGVPLNAILITMVPLVYVAAMSGAIHLANYYLDSLRERHGRTPIGEAVRHAALPLGLATATTAVGLLSLWYQRSGCRFACSACSRPSASSSALAMQLVLLPALLTRLARRRSEPAARSPS